MLGPVFIRFKGSQLLDVCIKLQPFSGWAPSVRARSISLNSVSAVAKNTCGEALKALDVYSHLDGWL